MVELAKRMKNKGHNVMILIYHDVNFFESELEASNITVSCVNDVNGINRIIECRNFIRNSVPDVLISFLEIPNFIAILASFPFRKWKLIVGERSTDPKILHSIKKKFFRWMYLFADSVVANSYKNMELIKKINPVLPSIKTHVIYNIVDREKWKLSPKTSLPKHDKFQLTIVASHQYLKNARGMIKAISLLKEKERNRLSVSWYGGGSNDNSFDDAISLIDAFNLNDVIKFYPPTNSIPEIFSQSDAVGLFSFYEGLPNAVCEAMMSGKPVIASNVSDIPRFLEEEYIFNPLDPESIKEKISFLLNTSIKSLDEIGVKNNIKAEILFNENKLVEQYLDIMKQ
jgi:glycosyltransferase involved in cell wall biosynthesis